MPVVIDMKGTYQHVETVVVGKRRDQGRDEGMAGHGGQHGPLVPHMLHLLQSDDCDDYISSSGPWNGNPDREVHTVRLPQDLERKHLVSVGLVRLR